MTCARSPSRRSVASGQDLPDADVAPGQGDQPGGVDDPVDLDRHGQLSLVMTVVGRAMAIALRGGGLPRQTTGNVDNDWTACGLVTGLRVDLEEPGGRTCGWGKEGVRREGLWQEGVRR